MAHLVDSQPSTQLKALELMGKACGLFTPTEVQDKAPVTADQLKRELASHLKLLKGEMGCTSCRCLQYRWKHNIESTHRTSIFICV